MDRRVFLRSVGLGAAALVVAPDALEPIRRYWFGWRPSTYHDAFFEAIRDTPGLSDFWPGFNVTRRSRMFWEFNVLNEPAFELGELNLIPKLPRMQVPSVEWAFRSQGQDQVQVLVLFLEGQAPKLVQGFERTNNALRPYGQ